MAYGTYYPKEAFNKESAIKEFVKKSTPREWEKMYLGTKVVQIPSGMGAFGGISYSPEQYDDVGHIFAIYSILNVEEEKDEDGIYYPYSITLERHFKEGSPLLKEEKTKKYLYKLVEDE